jgi:Zn-dependent peptidase ImmA (M78 family)/transcriptional regulator with XRE-family HTH domain
VKDTHGFDPRRLTLARWSAHLTKRDLAERSGLSPASVTQYEAGRTLPPPATLAKLALAVGVPVQYFERRPGRRRPDPAARSFFRSLRSTPQRDRDRADAFAEHVFDLIDYLDQRVTLPEPEVPQIQPQSSSREEIERIASEVRREWSVPDGPVANVVRLLEAHGVVVVRPDSGGTKLDAFSRWFGERPLVLLWGDKADKARSRFDAAHELGHLVMHSDPDPLDREQERQANMFASGFLMPADQVGRHLPRRAPTVRDWPTVLDSRKHWGVSAKALLYRSRELGALNEAGFRRSMIAYNQHRIHSEDGTALGPPEAPLLLVRAIQALGQADDPDLLASDALIPRGLVEDLVASSAR